MKWELSSRSWDPEGRNSCCVDIWFDLEICPLATRTCWGPSGAHSLEGKDGQADRVIAGSPSRGRGMGLWCVNSFTTWRVEPLSSRNLLACAHLYRWGVQEGGFHFDFIERVKSWGRAERRGGSTGSGTVGEVEGSRVTGYAMELLVGVHC